MLFSQWVMKGNCSGASVGMFFSTTSFKSALGARVHAGTMMKATNSRCKLPLVRTRFMASIKTSMPLLRYS